MWDTVKGIFLYRFYGARSAHGWIWGADSSEDTACFCGMCFCGSPCMLKSILWTWCVYCVQVCGCRTRPCTLARRSAKQARRRGVRRWLSRRLPILPSFSTGLRSRPRFPERLPSRRCPTLRLPASGWRGIRTPTPERRRYIPTRWSTSATILARLTAFHLSTVLAQNLPFKPLFVQVSDYKMQLVIFSVIVNIHVSRKTCHRILTIISSNLRPNRFLKSFHCWKVG